MSLVFLEALIELINLHRGCTGRIGHFASKALALHRLGLYALLFLTSIHVSSDRLSGWSITAVITGSPVWLLVAVVVAKSSLSQRAGW
jgi:hypothetical protein